MNGRFRVGSSTASHNEPPSPALEPCLEPPIPCAGPARSPRLAFSPCVAGAAGPATHRSRNNWRAGARRPGAWRRRTGRAFFTSRHGGEVVVRILPRQSADHAQGKHASTGKAIDPLAPAFNPKAFTDAPGRQVVPPQLQGRAGARMQRRREGRRAGLPDRPQAVNRCTHLAHRRYHHDSHHSATGPCGCIVLLGLVAVGVRRRRWRHATPPIAGACAPTRRNVPPATLAYPPGCCPPAHGSAS